MRGLKPVLWCWLLAASLSAQAQAPSPLDDSLAAEVAAFVDADRRDPPVPCRLLFVGSSSIVKWRDTLAADMAPWPVVNRGFGGSHIAHVNRWFDALVAAQSPSLIVFYAGENDIDAGKRPAEVIADFDQFLRRKRAALGATPVYFISLKPSPLRLAQLPLQAEVNKAVRARARRQPDLHYIDVVGLMLDHGKPRDIYQPDRLHMNRAGYLLWQQAVRAALAQEVDGAGQRCQRRQPSAVR